MLEIRLLAASDEVLFESVADDVFDDPIQPALAAEFLADPRHHMVAALDAGRIIGFASGVHYVHPDKPAEMFINEVGVAPTHQRRGIAAKLMHALFEQGRALGCEQAWVATQPDNAAARALYTSVGGDEDAAPFVVYSFSLEEPG